MYAPVRGAIIVSVFVILAAFSGCGGGGSASSADTSANSLSGGETALPVKTLSWEAPSSYSNGTPMTPLLDLDRFEVYLNESGSFNGSDVPQAILSAVDPLTHQLTTSFNLSNIPALTSGVQYWVTLRAVSRTGIKSDFSAPASFSF
ncbi:MAG: fibronectin type III domain-containing protein [Deltaproteobacteria bacterium]|nr:MAG: fibronectin type III domain-containing protein [Deltaproteobacteria bacterium]